MFFSHTNATPKLNHHHTPTKCYWWLWRCAALAMLFTLYFFIFIRVEWIGDFARFVVKHNNQQRTAHIKHKQLTRILCRLKVFLRMSTQIGVEIIVTERPHVFPFTLLFLFIITSFFFRLTVKVVKGITSLCSGRNQTFSLSRFLRSIWEKCEKAPKMVGVVNCRRNKNEMASCFWYFGCWIPSLIELWQPPHLF